MSYHVKTLAVAGSLAAALTAHFATPAAADFNDGVEALMMGKFDETPISAWQPPSAAEMVAPVLNRPPMALAVSRKRSASASLA